MKKRVVAEGTLPRRALASAIAFLSASALFIPSAAHAAHTTPAAPDSTSDLHVSAGISGMNARALAKSLGPSRTGGIYYNSNGRMVIAVTDRAAAQAVRAADGVPEMVKYSTATLKAIHTELDKLAGIPGTSWGVDPSTNQVSVELDSTVSAADTARIRAVTDKFGDATRVERLKGKIEKSTSSTGGERISVAYGGKQTPYCSLGFNVMNTSGAKYFITAGHCTNMFENWYQTWSGEYLGNNVRSSYPGNDYGIVKYNNTTVQPYGTVHHDTQQIISSRAPYDGEPVSRAGGVSNDMIGQVLLVDDTVNYGPNETVYHAIKTSNCNMAGDSGGALYNGTTALGITSGGNDIHAPCSDYVSDQRSWYQPLQSVLNIYNLSVY